MDYKGLVEVYEKIDSSSKRLDKTYHISKLLKKTKDEDLEMIILLLNGNIYPAWNKKEMGVAARLVLKAISLAGGISSMSVENEWRKTGDLGKSAFNLMQNKKQATLFTQNLTVEKVFKDLRKLTEISGHGAVDQKIKIIAGLLSSASPKGAQYIVRTVLEDLRVGIGDGTIRDSIVWSSVKGLIINYVPGKEGNNTYTFETELFLEELLKPKTDGVKNYYFQIVDIVQDAYNIKNDFAKVILILRGVHGIQALKAVDVSIGNPMKVMLYQKAKGISDAFERVGKPAAWEFKYDGFRLQIHNCEGKITLFTRRLDNVTNQFPDVVNVVKENIKEDNFIIDSEVVGYDKKTGKYLPFQNISQRIKRKYDIDRMARDYPVELNVFDILAKDNKSMLNEPFEVRRKAIISMIKEKEKEIIVAKQIITSDEEEAQEFYESALKAGEEGIMAKNLKGIYKPGSRVGYGVKVKPVMETLDLVIVGAEWGKGKRSGWLSSFHIACQDDEGNILDIGKVGTGIKELEQEDKNLHEGQEGVNKSVDEGKNGGEKGSVTFSQLTNLLKPLILEEKGGEVKVKAKIIIEVNYEEIQKSSKYSSGYALRFPRVVQIRLDKPVEEISSLDYVDDLYFGQK